MKALFSRYSATAAYNFFLILLTIGFCCKLNAQTIQYSKQDFKAPYTNAIKLVANVGVNHHIICLTQNSKLLVYVYSNNLQLQATKELDYKLAPMSDVNVVRFKNYYLLYIHQLASDKHELWKIDADGNSTFMSDSFMRLIGKVFTSNTSTLQLKNKDGQLAIVASAYYENLGKIGSAVILADDSLKPVLSRKVFFDFKRSVEGLRQVTLVGESTVMILKTSRDSAGHLLSIIKADLNTGAVTSNTFNSGVNRFVDPYFYYNEADSTATIYSKVANTVFFTRLDSQLNEKVPAKVVKTPYKQMPAFHFLLLRDKKQRWLTLRTGSPVFLSTRVSTTVRLYSSLPAYSSGFDMSGNIINNNVYPSLLNDVGLPNYSNYQNNPDNQQSSIRFSLLDDRFSVLKDSITLNDKSTYNLQPSQFANLVVHNKSYLFLGQQFGRNRQGVLMLNDNDKDELSATDIRVYDKYKYVLSQMQVVDDKYALMPYTYKRELGLVKIAVE